MQLFEISKSTEQVRTFDFSNCTEIQLGAPGRAQKLVIIPIVGEGESLRPKILGQNVVLVRGNFPDDGRCLIFINCDGTYRRNYVYDVFNPLGLVHLAQGHRAWGDAGGLGSQPHYLSLAEEGASFYMKHTYFGPKYYRYVGGIWLSETQPERDARIAREKFEQNENEGEWL